MSELVFCVLVKLEALRCETESLMPFHSLFLPVLEPLHVGPWLDKELHFHLLEFARAENEIAGSDFISERLSDLRDAERNFLSRRLLDVEKILVRSLSGLRSQIYYRRRVFHRFHS